MFIPDENSIPEGPLPSLRPKPKRSNQGGLDESSEGLDSLPRYVGPGIPSGMQLFYYVVECIDAGCHSDAIRKQIIAFGYPASTADNIIKDVIAWRQKNPTASAKEPPPPVKWRPSSEMILYGSILSLGGLAVILALGIGMSSAGGGIMIVPSGLILAGVGLFLRGMQLRNRPEDTPENKS